jgi:hypothetical protein
MAVIYGIDTFTGVNGTTINAHTADSGGSWTSQPAAHNTIQGNALECDVTGLDAPTYSAVPSSADYEASLDVIFNSAGASGSCGPTVRNASGNYYLTLYDIGSAGTFLLRMAANAVGAVLAGPIALAYTPGQTHRLTCRALGSTISALVDGVSIASVTDATYSAAGLGGLYMQNAGVQALRLDNWVMQDIGAFNPAWASRSVVLRRGVPA